MKVSNFVPSALASLPLPDWVRAQTFGQTSCSPGSFTFPDILGAEVSNIDAHEVHHHEVPPLFPGWTQDHSVKLNFCNVTVTYTHPGWNDAIHVRVWLPPQNLWTGNLHAVGGGGYSASFGPYISYALARGEVAIDTDAGHVPGLEEHATPRTWALASPGNVNLHLLDNLGSRSLHELAVIGKRVTEDFYGKPPKYSLFKGCSQGGRQGMVLAQRYPEDFDGILSMAPAINLDRFLPAGLWPYQIMNNLKTYPPPCEIEAFTRAAIDSCDELDGVADGVISQPSLCDFQASTVVGKAFSCNGVESTFSKAGAEIVQAAWDGLSRPSSRRGWFGVNKDAPLTTVPIITTCSPENNTCSAVPHPILGSWVAYFVAKDPNFPLADMTTEQLFKFAAQSTTEYHSIMSASDPDLSAFRAAGGKLLSWHGLQDQIIPPNGTTAYYEQVLELDPTADTFYRVFEAPGVEHCYGGPGHLPHSAFDQLLDWVANGVLPETLPAVNPKREVRNLCPYPLQQKYIGGDAALPESFECVDLNVIEDGIGGVKAAQMPFVPRT